nr:hypothetical protein [Sphingomonas sp. PAMC 26617]
MALADEPERPPKLLGIGDVSGRFNKARERCVGDGGHVDQERR